MKAALLLLSLCTGAAALQTDHAQSDAPETQPEQAITKAGEMFAANCVACHQVPDNRFAVDRAWLKQVADTA